MYKQCQTEQSAARQRQLERGLLEAMLHHDYEDISVSDLCGYMDVPRKTFYRYFSGKDGALHSMIDHAIMDFDTCATVEGFRELPEAKNYMETVFDYWIRNRELLDALQRSDLNGILIQRAIEYTKKQNALPAFLGSMEQDLRDYGTMFAVCGLMTMIVQWHHDGFCPDVSRMAALAIRLLSEPLFVPGK